MGYITIVYGMIKLNDFKSFQNTIRNMKPDKNYPWIRAEMFNTNAITPPYYARTPITTFGTSYKNMHGSEDWSEFILKFEYLLDEIDFDYARIRFETEYLGDSEFFWGKKTGNKPEFYEREDLIEQRKWFFGYGFRNMWGSLIHKNESEFPFDFNYPIEFDKNIKNKFNEKIAELNQIPTHKKTYFENYTKHIVFGDVNSHLILTYLKINNIIEYGWELEKGFFIKRLKEIKKIDTPYNIM